jgi:hypothetical protein
MSHRFQNIQGDLGNYTEELVKFCSSLKNQLNIITEHQSKGTDITIKHISMDLVQQEAEISKNLTDKANNCVSKFYGFILCIYNSAYLLLKLIILT